MDLLTIVRKIWRHRIFTVPVMVLTLVGAGYVVAVKKPVYEATSSFVLLSPPPPPTAEDVAEKPALGRINSDNPYTRFSDQSVIVKVVTSTMESDSAREALARAGADPRYAVAPSVEFGSTSPIIQITAAGWSAPLALRSSKIVDDTLVRELDRMQEVQGVDKRYRFKALPVDTPEKAVMQASGKLRPLIGVLVLGAVLLFIVVSVADALGSLLMERGQKVAKNPWLDGSRSDAPWPPDGAPNGEPWELWGDLRTNGTDRDAESDAVPVNGTKPVPDERHQQPQPDGSRRALAGPPQPPS